MLSEGSKRRADTSLFTLVTLSSAGAGPTAKSAQQEVALSRVLDSLDSYGDICVNRNPEMCTTGSAFLLIVSLFRLLVCFNQRFEGTSYIPFSFGHFCSLPPLITRIHTSLTWPSRHPSSPRILVSFGIRSAVPSCACFLLSCKLSRSVGGLVPLFHPCGWLLSFITVYQYSYILSLFISSHNNARAEKIPISKAKSSVQSKPQKSTATMNVTVSPTTTTEDEVIALRAENKVLRQALNAVEDTATEQLKKSFELVWFARNRCKCTRMCMHWSLLRHDIFCLCQLATSRNQT